MSNLPVNGPSSAPFAESAEAEASALYEQHGARVYAFCLGRLGDREEAADAVQDTYAKAWIALRDGVEIRQPLAWLLTIAGNVCTSRYRARSARPIEMPLPDDAEATVTYLPRAAELAGLPSALRALPDEQRRAFVLRELRGCSYGEIGRDLGVSYASVAALLHRSRRAIAANLRDVGGRALVAVPLPGVFKSAFEGGAAAVATTATCAILLTGPQIGSAPFQNRTLPPTPAGRDVTSTVPPGTEVVRDVGGGENTATGNTPVVATRARRGGGSLRGGTAAEIAASSARAGSIAPPRAPLDGSTAAAPVDAETPRTTEPTPNRSPPSVEGVTSPPRGTAHGASTSVTKTKSPASAASNGAERSLPPQANGNGSPGNGAGAGAAQSHGPPADPGASQGDGPPANPGSQGNGPPPNGG